MVAMGGRVCPPWQLFDEKTIVANKNLDVERTSEFVGEALLRCSFPGSSQALDSPAVPLFVVVQ